MSRSARRLDTFFLLAALAALGTQSAGAQEVWRCGPEGRSYSDAPCAQGRLLSVSDERSEQQVAQARQRAREEQRLAQRMQREREAREAAWLAANAEPIVIGPKRAGAKKSLEPRSKPHAPQGRWPYRRAATDTWPAAFPASPRKPG